jgi:hypothetical protein
MSKCECGHLLDVDPLRRQVRQSPGQGVHQANEGDEARTRVPGQAAAHVMSRAAGCRGNLAEGAAAALGAQPAGEGGVRERRRERSRRRVEALKAEPDRDAQASTGREPPDPTIMNTEPRRTCSPERVGAPAVTTHFRIAKMCKCVGRATPPLKTYKTRWQKVSFEAQELGEPTNQRTNEPTNKPLRTQRLTPRANTPRALRWQCLPASAILRRARRRIVS